jgi:hypothetical protein
VLLLVAMAGASCRNGPLCARTLRAVCSCSDPLHPGLVSCLTQIDVSGCGAIDAAVNDPCVINPCCLNLPADGGPPAADTGADQSPPVDGAGDGLDQSLARDASAAID